MSLATQDCDTWTAVGPADGFSESRPQVFIFNGWEILVVRSQGEIRAVENICTHGTIRMHRGFIAGGAVICPAHRARFDLATGQHVGSVLAPLRSFPVRIEGGRVEIAVPHLTPMEI